MNWFWFVTLRLTTSGTKTFTRWRKIWFGFVRASLFVALWKVIVWFITISVMSYSESRHTGISQYGCIFSLFFFCCFSPFVSFSDLVSIFPENPPFFFLIGTTYSVQWCTNPLYLFDISFRFSWTSFVSFLRVSFVFFFFFLLWNFNWIIWPSGFPKQRRIVSKKNAPELLTFSSFFNFILLIVNSLV